MLAIVSVLGGTALIASLPDGETPAPPPREEPPPPVPQIAPSGNAGKETEKVVPVSSSNTLDPYTVRPPFNVYDTLLFGSGDALPTALSDIEAPRRDAVCLDDEQKPWACGLQARAALYNMIRGNEVTCTPVAPATESVPARCAVAGRDLGSLMVEKGFARLKGRATSPLQERARLDRLGVWNGGWTIR